MAGYTPYRQDRTTSSGGTRGIGLCIFVNNSWCTISKEVSSYCSTVAVYIPPQSEAGTKTALNELYSAISKQETTHPEAALLVAGNIIAGKLKSISPNF